ncbi:methylenetetrahydrofolate reductase [Streptomyces actinomycinicus]|uniref:Methylenetetrahydrofolate reductase n=1 Tax=Streptomyces actinomycinicus TaxID=1695166 RepID=A0A937EMH0_9ACTN|nr:methylenetetrahydrofolate reductase [Streptomyces actinomycinicus]
MRRPGPLFSVEFFPPRDAAGERRLWRCVRELEPLAPAFASVTYGAGGSTRERTVQTTARLREQTTLCTVAHLAAVGHSVAELRHALSWYAATGVRNLLLVRGDPPGDPGGEWVAHPQGLGHAAELVALARTLGDFCVGVAAFPHGHPRSPDAASDLAHLVRKIRAGADFAVAQLFFDVEAFLRLRDRLVGQGCDVPLLPGVMPMTTPKVLRKAVELSGVRGEPGQARALMRYADDPAAFRAAGLDAAVRLCARLLDEGVPALHFYSLNTTAATRHVLDALGIGTRPTATPSLRLEAERV